MFEIFISLVIFFTVLAMFYPAIATRRDRKKFVKAMTEGRTKDASSILQKYL